jgi:hypothetical protein
LGVVQCYSGWRGTKFDRILTFYGRSWTWSKDQRGVGLWEAEGCWVLGALWGSFRKLGLDLVIFPFKKRKKKVKKKLQKKKLQKKFVKKNCKKNFIKKMSGKMCGKMCGKMGGKKKKSWLKK